MEASPVDTYNRAFDLDRCITIDKKPHQRSAQARQWLSRRELLASGLAYAALASGAAATSPTLGLLSPVDAAVPPDAAIMYPTGIRFRCVGAGLKQTTPQGYDQVVDRLEPLEKRCGIPVVTSLPHALQAGARLLGLSGRVPGYGRLLSL